MRELLLLALFGLFSISVHAKSPNVIVLLADDAGWGDFSCFVPFTKPHSPWSAPVEDWARFKDKPLAQTATLADKDGGFVGWWQGRASQPNPKVPWRRRISLNCCPRHRCLVTGLPDHLGPDRAA